MGFSATSDALAGKQSLPQPSELKVTVGNKHMMADEGIAVPAAVDDYMRRMEVGLHAVCSLPCACGHSLLAGPALTLSMQPGSFMVNVA